MHSQTASNLSIELSRGRHYWRQVAASRIVIECDRGFIVIGVNQETFKLEAATMAQYARLALSGFDTRATTIVIEMGRARILDMTNRLIAIITTGRPEVDGNDAGAAWPDMQSVVQLLYGLTRLPPAKLANELRKAEHRRSVSFTRPTYGSWNQAVIKIDPGR